MLKSIVKFISAKIQGENMKREIIVISKKNNKFFHKFDRFLPTNFKKILKKMRTDEKERLERLGIV